LRTAASDKYVYVKNSVARYPAGGCWPLQMRADMAAAFLDFSNTRELCAAVANGDAPLPTATRTRGKSAEVVWFKDALHQFAATRSRFRPWSAER
jgi:hypothetical protein